MPWFRRWFQNNTFLDSRCFKKPGWTTTESKKSGFPPNQVCGIPVLGRYILGANVASCFILTHFNKVEPHFKRHWHHCSANSSLYALILDLDMRLPNDYWVTDAKMNFLGYWNLAAKRWMIFFNIQWDHFGRCSICTEVQCLCWRVSQVFIVKWPVLKLNWSFYIGWSFCASHCFWSWLY